MITMIGRLVDDLRIEISDNIAAHMAIGFGECHSLQLDGHQPSEPKPICR